LHHQYVIMGLDFRRGNYRRYVRFGKRTVKDGEACAVWDMYGRHRQVVGPALVRMFYSHIRFLDKFMARPDEFLSVTHNDGSLQHINGPVTAYLDPVLHKSMSVHGKRELTSTKQHLVVYSKRDSNTNNLKGSSTRLNALERNIITGPTVFMPEVDDRIHEFHFSKFASSPLASSTPTETFEILHEDQNLEQMHFKVKTAEGTETNVRLSLEVTIDDIAKFVGGEFDLPKEIVRAVSADIANQVTCKWNEIDDFMKSFTHTAAKFANLNARLIKMGVKLNCITYVGSNASPDVLRRHKEEEEKVAAVASIDRKLARERQMEKERQQTELDRILLEGKCAETKIKQERQRIEAEQELEKVRVDFENDIKKRKEEMSNETLRKEGDETIRFLKELKNLDVDIGQLLIKGKMKDYSDGEGEDGISASVSTAVAGLRSFVRGEMAKEFRTVKPNKEDMEENFVEI